MKRWTIRTIVAILLLAPCAFSQITIDWTEVPKNVGDSANHKICTGMVTIDVGNPGGPQTWTFDTTYAGFTEIRFIDEVAGSPFEAEFPTANHHRVDEAPDETSYVYNVLNSTEMIWLGMAAFINDSPVVMRYNPAAQALELPFTLGTTWDTYAARADSVDSLNYILLEYYYENVVDAYGTLDIPFGSFPTLRINSLICFIMTMVVDGSVLMADTSDFREFAWFIENYGAAVVAQSESGDTSTYFTNTSCYNMMLDGVLGDVAEEGGRTVDPFSMSVGPSPFRTQATLELTVPSAGVYSVSIVDASGRKVRDLHQGVLPEGSRTLIWNGTGKRGDPVAPGVYFAVLWSDIGVLSRKLLRMR
jgi:hypothetical protein